MVVTWKEIGVKVYTPIYNFIFITLQLYVYGEHKISACHREIEVFGHHVSAIERAIGITVGFVSPVEDIVKLENEVYLPDRREFQGIDHAQVLHIVVAEHAGFVLGIVHVLPCSRIWRAG